MTQLLRWSEQELEAHLKRHQSKRESFNKQQKIKNGITIANKIKQASTSEINNYEEKVILNCEIGLIPPSVNHYWMASGKKRYLSNQARQFHEVVRLIVPAHRTTSRLKLDVTFHFPNKQCRDIDNYLKATIDSLVKCGLCVDDEQFDQLIVHRGNVIKGGLIRLCVSEIGHG